MDDYEETCAAYREADEKKDWRAFSFEALQRCSSGSNVFDADASGGEVWYTQFIDLFVCLLDLMLSW